MKQDRPALVLHLGALGDFLLALPAIAALSADSVEVWGPVPERLHLALAPRGPIARVGSLPHELFLAPGSTPALDERLASFSRIVAFVREDAGPLVSRVHALGGEVVPPFPPAGSTTHATDFVLGALRERGLAREEARGFPAIDPTPADVEAARALLRAHGVEDQAPIVVHPGSGGRTKRWDASRFAAVAAELRSHGAAPGSRRDVVALLGPAELDGPLDRALRLEGVARAVLEAPPLATVLGLLGRASLFLGNDGGVAHLAAAAGAPVVAVFGPTDPRVWAPRGRAPVRVVAAPGGELARLEPGDVLQAARETLARAGVRQKRAGA